jgi:hypothetical protein
MKYPIFIGLLYNDIYRVVDLNLMSDNKTPVGVRAAIWTGIFVLLAAIVTGVINRINNSRHPDVSIENSQNAVVGSNNTVNQNISADHDYDATKDGNVLEKYFSPRYHTTFYYPTQWQPGRQPENGDGWSAKDPNGSATVTFYGSQALKPDATFYEEDDWHDYYEQLKPDSGGVLLDKEETAFYIRNGQTKSPISAAILKYNIGDTYYIQKTTLDEDGCLTFIVSCSIDDKSKYQAIFNKMINDIFIEQVEYQSVPAKK